jgi:predicted RNase H-related nuclease YkuK (DUF458 family)
MQELTYELKYKLAWYKYDGTRIDDVSLYVKEFMKKYPRGTVTIGCDSQEHSNYIKYSASISMHMIDQYGIGHGGHVIAANVIDKTKNAKSDFFTKLFAEAEISVQAAQELNLDQSIRIIIHLDYNSKKTELSNALYSTGLGYVKGMLPESEVYGKPDAWVASCAADAICKNKQAKKIPTWN